MTVTDTEEMALAGPERPGGQGLDPNQEESGNRAIHLLLTDTVVGPQTDFVATYRDGAYEVWAQRGMVRFQRSYGEDGGYQYRVIETLGNIGPDAEAAIPVPLRRCNHRRRNPTTGTVDRLAITDGTGIENHTRRSGVACRQAAQRDNHSR